MPPHPVLLVPACLPRRRCGFTLIELMVTLSVLVVVTSVALPSMADFLASNQVVASKTAFAGAVALARTEAAKRGKVVIVQALGDGPVGNEFINGWEIVADDDGNGVAGANETRVRRATGTQDKVRLSGNPSLAFRATGALVGTAAVVYTVCRASGSTKGYSITVTPSGATDVASISTCS